MKGQKLNIVLDIILIIIMIIAIILLSTANIACKRLQDRCENFGDTRVDNNVNFLRYTDKLGNPTYFEPLEIKKEDK